MKLNSTYSLFLFLVVAMLSACRPTASTISSVVETRKDTTFVKEITHYDTVIIAGDSIPYEVRIECDEKTNKPKPVQFKARSGRASVDMTIDKNGLLKGTAACDHLVKVLESKDRELTHLQSLIRKENKVEVKISHEPYWFDKIARVLAIILILLVILKFTKFLPL